MGQCNYTCRNIIAAMYLPTNDGTPKQAADAYWAAYTASPTPSTTTPSDGCTAVSIPFDATYGGKSARVLVHVDVGSPAHAYLNGSYPTQGAVLPTSQPGSIAAAPASSTFLHGGVLVVDVVRTDANPLDARGGTVELPRGPFLCVSPSGRTGVPAVRVALLAPPPVLTTAERAAIATVSAGSADLQTVAAIGLLRCSPGAEEDVETDAGVRALVPVALSGTCAGAVQGAFLAIGVAALASVCVTLVVMRVRGVGWTAAAAVTRCPGLVIAVWAFVQMGLVVCGARLVTGNSLVLGAAGVAAGGALPVVCVALTWGVVSRRCYRLAQTPKAAAGRSGLVVRLRSLLLPSYELDGDAHPVSKAYSAVVGRSRRPSCLWSALPVMQPVVMLLVVFVQGAMCSTSLIVAGVVLLLLGAVCHMLFRPHRILAANHLQGGAMALNAAVLIVASKLVSDPLDLSAVGANRAIAMIQVGLSVSRMAHTVGTVVYMRLFGTAVFQLCDPSYENMVGPDSDDSPTTSLSIPSVAPVFEYISPCSQYTTNRRKRRVVVEEDLLAPLTPVVVDDPHHQQPQPDEEELVSHRSTTPILSDRGSVDDDTPPAPPPASAPPKKKVAKKTNTQFSESIISTVVGNHKGYVPMERPYTMLWESDDDDLDDDDLNLDVKVQNSIISSASSMSEGVRDGGPLCAI